MSLTLVQSSHASQPRHAHDSLVLGVVLAGTRRIEAAGASTRVPQGAVFVLAPGQAHACAPAQSDAKSDVTVNATVNAWRDGKRTPGAAAVAESDTKADAKANATPNSASDAGTDAAADAAAPGCSYLALSIAPHALPPELAGWRAASPRLDDPALARALARLAEALDAPTGRLERQSLLAECLELLARHDGRAPGQDGVGGGLAKTARMQEAAGAARRLIAENLEAGVDLAGLAAACGVDMFALHRAFTRELGLPPHAFQTHLRLRRAKELLRCGTSLAEAALRSGFCDQAHMTRHFARVVGLSPARYARAHANSARPGTRPNGRSGGRDGDGDGNA